MGIEQDKIFLNKDICNLAKANSNVGNQIRYDEYLRILKEENKNLKEENKNLKDKLEQIQYITFYSDYGDGTVYDKLYSIQNILVEDD